MPYSSSEQEQDRSSINRQAKPEQPQWQLHHFKASPSTSSAGYPVLSTSQKCNRLSSPGFKPASQLLDARPSSGRLGRSFVSGASRLPSELVLSEPVFDQDVPEAVHQGLPQPPISFYHKPSRHIHKPLSSPNPVRSDPHTSPSSSTQLQLTAHSHREERAVVQSAESENSYGRNGCPIVQGIELVSHHRLPEKLKSIFPHPLFNAVQSKCFETIYSTDENFVLSAPTGSGKTAIFELAICRLVINQPNQSFKIVYLAPTKSLCAERYRDWHTKFARLGLSSAEMTGDTETSQMRLVAQADILITTPEKWDSITRRWQDHHRLVDLVKLFLIDEVHILKDDRGAILEAVVSRMKTVGSQEVRFVALSATVPNPQDIAQWLGTPGQGNSRARMEVFDESFRPVKLEKHVYSLPSRGVNDFVFEKACSNKLQEVILKFAKPMKPIMIFCFTRKSTETTARLLQDWHNSQPPTQRLWRSSLKLRVTDAKLQQCVNAGVAYHHAGLDLNDRAAIEKGYVDDDIGVICCTSTLAVGLNLPCHTVIIKNTVCYQAGEGLKEYSDLEIMQMLGRAGRPQFGKTAVAVIMTRQEKAAKYEEMVSGREILESRLHLNLVDHLNAEISLSTIFDKLSAKVWLRGTFFAVRFAQNPEHYRLEHEQSRAGIPDRNNVLARLCDRDLEVLRQTGLIIKDQDDENFKSTGYGEAMARYYVHLDTMRAFLSLPIKPKMGDIIAAISKADEFKSIRLQSGQKQLFREINSSCSIKFPIKVDLARPDQKVSLIIQSILGGIDLFKDEKHIVHKNQFQTDSTLIFQHIHRFIRCIIDCQLHDEDAVGAQNALELARSFSAKAWDDSPLQMIQIPQIGPVAVRKFVNAGIRAIEELQDLDSQRIDMILSKNPPFGMNLLSKLETFPNLRVALRSFGQPAISSIDGHKVIQIKVKAELGFLNTIAPALFANKAIFVCLLAATSDGRKVHFCRMSGTKIGRGLTIDFPVDIVNPNQVVTCSVSCAGIAGTLKYAVLEPKIPISMFVQIGGTSLLPIPLAKVTKAENTKVVSDQVASDPEFHFTDDDILQETFSPALPRVASTGDSADFVDIDRVESVESGRGPFSKSQNPDLASLSGVWKQRVFANNQGPNRGSTPGIQHAPPGRADRSSGTDNDQWEPQKLKNGNWECNHICKNKLACKHRCCQEGTEKPPKRPKAPTLKLDGAKWRAENLEEY